jgi:GTP diphosphokinase / guanosine-3',5'-bis(diphosphate) 3'-diphosphatase
MTSVSSNVSLGKEIAVISTTLEIDGLEQMQRVFARLEKVKGVILVERDLGKHKKN